MAVAWVKILWSHSFTFYQLISKFWVITRGEIYTHKGHVCDVFVVCVFFYVATPIPVWASIIATGIIATIYTAIVRPIAVLSFYLKQYNKSILIPNQYSNIHFKHFVAHRLYSVLINPLLFSLCTYMKGGMKAVVWTDVFQGLVLFSGVIAVLIVVGH